MIEYLSEFYQLGTARKNFKNQRKSDQANREQVGKKNTKECGGGSKQEIRERVMEGKHLFGGEHCGAINWGERDFGASDRRLSGTCPGHVPDMFRTCPYCPGFGTKYCFHGYTGQAPKC